MDNKAFKTPHDTSLIQRLKVELGELERDMINIDGKMMKPSQCYHLDLDPVHVLFNTNCPDTLRDKIQTILSKHLKPGETGAE